MSRWLTAVAELARRQRPISKALRSTLPIVIGAALVAPARNATPGSAAVGRTASGSLGATASTPAAAYSVAVSQICSGALLFDSAHEMGTLSDALSIADDIRASTARRLARVTALSVPPEIESISTRWINSQRRLAALFATTWVRIYATIDAAQTPAQQATLADRLEKLVHAPDLLKLAGGRLERELDVPDCTGGG
jgi:hypothetical protein